MATRTCFLRSLAEDPEEVMIEKECNISFLLSCYNKEKKRWHCVPTKHFFLRWKWFSQKSKGYPSQYCFCSKERKQIRYSSLMAAKKEMSVQNRFNSHLFLRYSLCGDGKSYDNRSLFTTFSFKSSAKVDTIIKAKNRVCSCNFSQPNNRIGKDSIGGL